MAHDPTNIMVQSRFSLEKLFGDSDIAIMRGTPHLPSPDPLVVIFDSRSSHFGKPEFIGTIAGMGRHALFIADHKRAWFASPKNHSLIISAVRDEMRRLGCAVIDTLGFSMGGFAAIAYAETLPVQHAMAFSPRYSIDPRQTTDRRVRPGLIGLGNSAVFRSLDPGLAKLHHALVLHGTPQHDLAHVRMLAAPKHVDHFVFAGVDHNVPLWLKKQGLLGALTRVAMAPNRAEAATLLQNFGAERRSRLSMRMTLLNLDYRSRLRRLVYRQVDPPELQAQPAPSKQPLH